MIVIDKNTKDYLEKKGCKFGDDLHRTYCKSKTYYATESSNVLSLIDEYRKSRLTK